MVPLWRVCCSYDVRLELAASIEDAHFLHGEVEVIPRGTLIPALQITKSEAWLPVDSDAAG